MRQEVPPSTLFTLQIKHPGSPSRLRLTNAGINLQKIQEKLTIMCYKVQTTNCESQLKMHHLVYYSLPMDHTGRG